MSSFMKEIYIEAPPERVWLEPPAAWNYPYQPPDVCKKALGRI